MVLLLSKIARALTIAGLDSGGGAGIIADIKTFSALGVFGMAAITSVTAQNTKAVLGIHDVPEEMIKLQIKAVAEDIGIDAAKTGMLHTASIIKAVAEEIKNYDFPLVVDPVMIAKSGAELMKADARNALIKYLLPHAKIVTPNIPEAEALTRIKIRSIDDAKKVAKIITEKYGCEAVVIKGGHLTGEKSIDILHYNGEFYTFETPRIETKNTHGTGCTYSAAVTAELAKGKSLIDAVKTAKVFTYLAIKYGFNIGQGYGPVNHMAWLYREAERYEIIKSLKKALNLLESNPRISELIPEVGMNIALASTYSIDKNDVAAIPGRIRPVKGKAKACGCPEFGVSKHLASYILTAREYDAKIRAAVNIKFDEKILEKLKLLGLTISHYDRLEEPEEFKKIEGMTIPWGTKEAIKRVGKVPDVIYHRGDWGKEPMIVLLGESLEKLINILLKLVE